MRTLLLVGLAAAGIAAGGCRHVVHHALWHHHRPHVVVHHPRSVVVVKPRPAPEPRVVTPKKKVLLPHEILAQRHKEHMKWLTGGD